MKNDVLQKNHKTNFKKNEKEKKKVNFKCLRQKTLNGIKTEKNHKKV